MADNRFEVARAAALPAEDEVVGAVPAPAPSGWSDVVYHRLCPAAEVAEGEPRAFTVNGTHLAVFRHDGGFYAVDNRCPHMGYPFSKGTVKDGILICHWHHWQFDLKTGGCFVGGGDDVRTFPVEVRDGDLFVGISAGEQEEARRRMVARGERALQQGLKDASSFLIAKAVTALRSAGATPKDIVRQGLLYGVTRTNEGWSSGVAILTIGANMWDEVDPEDHNLFLVHGLTQIGRRTAGRSNRRRQFPLPGAETHDVDTLKRWFRRFVDQRDVTGAERILMTLSDRGYPKSVIADFIFTTATDSYFKGDGHALDFGNKTLEALDFIDWEGAVEVLRPIVIDLIVRDRHEETALWAESVPLLEDVFARLDEVWADNQNRRAGLDISAFAQTLLGEDLRAVVSAVEARLREGASCTDICRALTYAGAIRTARFHLKNEGDWHAVANLYSYAHALYRAFHIAPSRDLLRGIFHGAVYTNLIRWLNMPAARVPRPGEGTGERYKGPGQMLDRLQEFADFQKVYEAELLVNQYLAEGHDVPRLRRTLTHILLREDAELHMFQALEAAYRHYDLSKDEEERRIHLLAATRYITAQKVMKGILWSTENAERLQRGELLSEREDDN